MKLAPTIFGRIFVGLALALAIPFGARAQESVVVSYDGYAGFQGPLWATKDLDLFRKHGLKAEMVLITGSTRGMAALISGSSDFAQGSASASIPIRLRGGDLVIIAAALNKFPFSIVAQREIRKPSDLIGKKIGILNFGGSTDLAITLAFKEWNIPRNAVTIFASGGAPERFAALSSRALDATVLSPPETIAAARMGMNILAHLSDLKGSLSSNRDDGAALVFGEKSGNGEAVRARLQRSDLRLQNRQSKSHGGLRQSLEAARREGSRSDL